MDFEVSYTLDNEQQFWDELEDIISTECDTHELIDNALRNYLSFTTTYKDEYLHTDYDITKCSARLLESTLFKAHRDYVRRQIIYCLLQEDSPDVLHQVSAFLFLDGTQNEETFEVMNEVGAFSRLIELVQIMKDSGPGLHRMLMQLLYEMSRRQRIRHQELMMIEEDFMIYLLQLIEAVSDDVNDPYHYPVIRVLLVLNEQYMVATHTLPVQSLKSPTIISQTITSRTGTINITLPNRLISALSSQGSSFRTFGENIILLLNRESETSLQLLILKILYLLFTTQATYEYFYTNDLRVLVDVMLRNLLDLPFSARALRHTYLRVLHPLLANTQLHLAENHYKREEILKVLSMLVGSSGGVAAIHFGQIDETTKRLGVRCARVPWLDEDGSTVNLSPVATTKLSVGTGDGNEDGLDISSIRLNEKATESSLSVVGNSVVAAVIAKPGEQTPSRGKDTTEISKIASTGRGENEGVPTSIGGGAGNGADDGDGEGGVKVTTSPVKIELNK